ncbi:MAG: pitrilysin family protein [Erysipelotrichaceae bacterium]|nr:pitrilysin family protein [Erysipelotrichaceae bacterium]
MQKIYNDKYQETIYKKILINGLRVHVIHKPDYNSSSAFFAVPFGSLDYKQYINKLENEVPSGAAHFLEHKLFEDKDKDVMGMFSNIGANVNAFTSYNETVYYFTTSNQDVVTPLTMLIDFVQNLNIDEKSIEKEKGIIMQELLMYKQIPDHRLLMETLKALYHQFPLKYDIVGSEESVKRMSLNDLNNAYELNYFPKNMLLTIVTPTSPELIFDVIEKNQNKKTFKDNFLPKRAHFNEPINVVNDFISIKMDVNKTKVCLAFKLPVLKETSIDRIKTEWGLRLLLEGYFTGLNNKYQDWLDEKKITDYFGYDVDISDDYALLLFYNEIEDPFSFKEMVVDQLLKLKKELISDELLIQLKRRYFGKSIRLFNNVSDIGVAYLRSVFDEIDIFESMNIINNIDRKTLISVVKRLDLSNASIVEIRKTEG